MLPSRCPRRRVRPSPSHCSAQRLARFALALLSAILLLLGAAPLALLGPVSVAHAQSSGTLTVKVYQDTDRDGQDDGAPADTPLAGRQVAVYSVDDRLAVQSFTSDAGVALFENLPYGQYRVEVTPPDNYVISAPGPAFENPGLVFRAALTEDEPAASFAVGLRALNGSGVDPAAPAGTRNLDVRVWDDRDADGVQDADEPGLEGLQVQIFNTTGNPIRTAAEAPDGRYLFLDAPLAGSSTVRVTDGISPTYSLTRQDFSFNGADQRDSDGILSDLPEYRASVFSSLPALQGVNDDSIDIGFARAAVSGYIFRDVNANGSFTPGSDTRLNGIRVQLIDVGGTPVMTETTRAEVGTGGISGVYRFTGVLTGTYRVRVPASEFQEGGPLFGAANPENNDDRGLPDGIVDPGSYVETAPFTLSLTSVSAGSNVRTDMHFGFYKGSVGDFVWFDLDREGDPDELTEGQNGIRVFVDDGRGNGIADNGIREGDELSTFTGNDPVTGRAGFYRFDDVPLGLTTTIALDPANFLPGGQLEGIGVGNALSATNALTQTYYFTTTEVLTTTAPNDFTADFGLVRSDIGNFVFEDANGNGYRDAGDSPIPNVTVELWRAGTNTLITSTTTTSSGVYTMPNLPAVGYYAVFDLTTAGAPYTDTGFIASPMITDTVAPDEATIDWSDVITPTGAHQWRTDVFTPTVGIPNNGVDAGFYQETSLAGRAFFDTDNDDLDEASPEPGMRGVAVHLRRADDLSLVQTTTTAISDTGVFSFTAVAPGRYRVDFVNPISTTFSLITGTTDVTVTGQLNSDVETILPAGDVGRTGVVDVLSRIPVSDLDAGFRGRGELSGRVFLDDDGSDTLSAGDSNLDDAAAALTVTASTPNLVATYSSVFSPTVAVDPGPNYSFPFLPFGPGVTYTLAISPPTTVAPDRPYMPSLPDVGGDDDVDSDGPTLVITETAASLDVDQGFYQEALVTARVFEEVEATAAAIDNQFDGGAPGGDDTGIGGVTVGIEAITGTLTLTDTTLATGLVTFTVKPGSYRLTIDPSDSDLGARVPSPGWSELITLTANPLTSDEESNTNNTGTNSFGYYSPASVSGMVFFDRNEDSQKAGEPGVGGVEVLLTGPGGPFTTTTDLAGVYTFTGLLPGAYTATFTNPDRLNFAFITGGSSDVTAPGNLAASATAAGSITVLYGQPSTAIDAGLVGRSQVEGTAFVDVDANGQQDDGPPQPVLEGVTVTLELDVSLPGVLTTRITREVTTTATGAYTLTGLLGDPDPDTLTETAAFTMTFTAPSAARPWNLTAPDVGDDDADSDGELAGQTLPRGTLAAVAVADRDQGYYQDALVTARVFEEATSAVNNQFNDGGATGDVGIGAVDVSLEYITGTLVLSDTTDSTGVVTFTVRPGSYRLNLDQADVPATLVPSPGFTDPFTVTGDPLTSGEDSLTDSGGANSFGYYRPATISGTVFFDRDLDNRKAGEPGVGGVVVELDDGSATISTTTTVTGAYSFTNLVSDTYTLRVTNPEPLNFSLIVSGTAPLPNDSVVDSSGAVSVVAAYGASVGDQDAGLRGLAAVGGRTFEDRNADGDSETGGDPGLTGVTVTLTLDVRIPGTLTTQISRTAVISAATGVYTFTGLPGAGGALGGTAAYSLTFAAPDASWVTTTADVGDDQYDSDGPEALAGEGLGLGAQAARDQGYYQEVTISGLVFEERVGLADNDYVAGDLGLGGVEVGLETITGTLVLSRTTEATGVVSFTARPGVDYRLRLDPADVAAPRVPSPGFSNPLTVTGNPLLSGQSSPADATAGANSFGYYRPSLVTGTVFFDRDLDGLKLDEPGLGGVAVELRSGAGTAITTTTTATGTYSFTNLLSDTYTLVFTNPSTLNFSFFTGGDSDLASGGAVLTRTIDLGTVGYGVIAGERDAGLRGLAAVGGRTFEDRNADGDSETGGDPGLTGVTVTLELNVNIPGTLTTRISRTAVITAATGVYSFTGLPGGGTSSYSLTFTAPDATWLPTAVDQGDDQYDSDGSDDLTDEPLAIGGSPARDQGYYQNATVRARIFDERVSVNNTFEAGEQGIAGVGVRISTTPVVSGTSDPTGLVTFTVKPGVYTLDSLTSVPVEFTASPTNTGTLVVTVLSGEEGTGDFGYFKTNSLVGTAWFDSSRTGLRDPGEPGMERILVTLQNGAGDEIKAPVQTDVTGTYTITGVLPNVAAGAPSDYRLCFSTTEIFTYTVREGPVLDDGNSDVDAATGCTDPFTVLSSNTVITTTDAGYVGLNSIGDLVWDDVDNDGVQDATEDGLQGALVTLAISSTGGLINATDPTVTMTATSRASVDLAWNYLVDGVPPAAGFRVVSVAPPLGFVPAPANQGGEDGADSDAVGETWGPVPPSVDSLDFGFVGVTTVGDLVWLDLDGDGRYNPAGEAGVPGVRVELLGGAGVVSTTTTRSGAQAGLYAFEDLPPGSYSLRFTPPAGYVFTNNGAGLITEDNDNDARGDGTTASFTLAPGQRLLTIDAGLRGTGSIDGLVWVDENRNDVRDPTDTRRLAGVQVTLTLTPTLAPGRPLTATTTTAADGIYSFANLPQGLAAVRFAQPAGYFPVVGNVGSDSFDSDGPTAPVNLSAGARIDALDMGYRARGLLAFLPMVRSRAPLPELTASLTVTPATPVGYAPAQVAVTVTNSGDLAASNFWVDLYINPSRVPAVNDPWNEVCSPTIAPCLGIAWYYTGTLEPGQSVTLTSAATSETDPNGYLRAASVWPGYFVNGTSKLYVFVDSWNRDASGAVRDPNGAVAELNETNNLSELNITVTPGTPPGVEAARLSTDLIDRSTVRPPQ